MRAECLREKWQVTEWRNGEVWATESMGLVWVPIDTPDHIDKDHFYTAVSTSYVGKRIRYAKVEEKK